MTADTSVVVAALSAWHDRHGDAAAEIRDVSALPAHVLLEAYSVLTRLPSGLAVPATLAATTLLERFPGPPLRIDSRAARRLTVRLAAAGVFGGSSYDGLIALEASSNGEALLTLDSRAEPTYRRLGVDVRVVGPT